MKSWLLVVLTTSPNCWPACRALWMPAAQLWSAVSFSSNQTVAAVRPPVRYARGDSSACPEPRASHQWHATQAAYFVTLPLWSEDAAQHVVYMHATVAACAA